MTGKAYLVGAGPGRPDLITVRGLRLLQRAEVVIYDHLIARELLEETPATAERIFAGKDPQHHALSQEAITRLLVEQVQRGKQVVRLKGGDPFVFGRGSEEALALVRAGLPFEVVPGVTSAVAVPAYAGVPVTHRGVATAFAVVTGHEADGHAERTTDWGALAHLHTLVVMMGLRHVQNVCTALLEAGRNPDTPAIAISWGTTDQQQTVYGTITTLPATVAARQLPTPVVIVIGEVAALASELAWFQPDGRAAGFVEPAHDRLRRT
ncbi:MAG: uroporphyrinogen-III C-methyltransferase [Chloroflexaceae bacterium]|nr:uroporphyrinogen-III C-methyltransferase [Chloroflexaceae bacterium]